MKLIFLGDALAEHLRRWAKSFALLGNEVHVVTWNHRVLDGYDGVTLHRLEKPIQGSGVVARVINLYRLRAKVRQIIKDVNPDLIHAHSAGAYAWMAMFTGFHPYVVTPWGDDILVTIHGSFVEYSFTTWGLRKADIVHIEGEDTLNVVESLGVARGKTLVMPLGVDVDIYKPGKPSSEFLDANGLSGSRVVISTRTLNPNHDVKTTIDAAAIVLKNTPDLKFLMIGGGADAVALKDLVHSLGLMDSIIFKGHVEESEMVKYLQAATLYVSSSPSDSGTPASTAEAMSCGLPIISTDAGDVSSTLGDGEGGYIVPIGDSKAVAERILFLLNDPKLIKRMGNRNREYVVKNINVHIVRQRMGQVYQSLID